MPFKTAEDGHVYNDDKKHSGTHHGSVRPTAGVKLNTKASTDKNRKDQHMADLKWSNFTTYGKTFDSLNKYWREQLLIEAGIPKENYEISTIQDAREYVDKPYNKLPDLTRKRINVILKRAMDNQLHNEAFAH